jgi:hypothetical protein
VERTKQLQLPGQYVFMCMQVMDCCLPMWLCTRRSRDLVACKVAVSACVAHRQLLVISTNAAAQTHSDSSAAQVHVSQREKMMTVRMSTHTSVLCSKAVSQSGVDHMMGCVSVEEHGGRLCRQCARVRNEAAVGSLFGLHALCRW